MSLAATLALALVVGYLLGSLSGSLLLGRLRGVDIRRLGSGNAGGTNALRTQGPAFALGVILIDIGKGSAAAWLGGVLAIAGGTPALATALTAAAGAVLGHNWPLYFGFRGGKGAATLVGAILVLMPLAFLPLLAIWALLIITTGYVGLATVCTGLAFVPVAGWLSPVADRTLWLGFAAGAALLLAYTHRDNLRRLLAGTEHRFEQARLLRRWRSR